MQFTLIFFLFQQSIKIDSSPVSRIKIQAKLDYEILNTNAEFYKRTSSVLLENGKLAVLDVGNKCVKLFRRNKLLLTFGKEGSGPGELDRPDKIYTVHNTLIVRENYKLLLFSDMGEYIRFISLMNHGQVGHPLIFDGLIRVYFDGNAITSYIDYNLDGKVLQRQKNPNHTTSYPKEDDTVLLRNSIKIMQINHDIYRSGNGHYRLEILNSNFTLDRILYRDFNSKKRNLTELVDQMVFDKSITGDELRRAKNYELNLLLKKISVNDDDIISLVGQYNNGCLMWIRSEQSGILSFDFIKENKLLSQFSIQSDQATEIRVFENNLIINTRNTETGPSISVYKLN